MLILENCTITNFNKIKKIGGGEVWCLMNKTRQMNEPNQVEIIHGEIGRR
jgi:hypothetical protein